VKAPLILPQCQLNCSQDQHWSGFTALVLVSDGSTSAHAHGVLLHPQLAIVTVQNKALIIYSFLGMSHIQTPGPEVWTDCFRWWNYTLVV